MQTPLSRVLGAKTATAMEESLGLRTVRDLLRHYPRRYARRGEMVKLENLRVGDRITRVARVQKVAKRKTRRRPGPINRVTVTAGANSMQLVFFNNKHPNLREG